MKYIRSNYISLVVAFLLGFLFGCSQPKPKMDCKDMPTDTLSDTTKITKKENIK